MANVVETLIEERPSQTVACVRREGVERSAGQQVVQGLHAVPGGEVGLEDLNAAPKASTD